jgi:Heterokaryon incompatibility protein (HET)
LSTASLLNVPIYQALSYEWAGEALEYEGRIRITVNAKPVFPTRNLAYALAQMRIDLAIPLWVDAVCINQQDDDEKSRQVRLHTARHYCLFLYCAYSLPLQVQMMKEIYENAQIVNVWLGPEHPAADAAMDLLARPAAGAQGFVSLRYHLEGKPSYDKPRVMTADLALKARWESFLYLSPRT